jgi:hypothetical protein
MRSDQLTEPIISDARDTADIAPIRYRYISEHVSVDTIRYVCRPEAPQCRPMQTQHAADQHII